MYFYSLNYKFLFILTLFNSLLSLLIGDSVINITDNNFIEQISLSPSNNFKINLNIGDNDKIYLSLISYNNSDFNINSNINFTENTTSKSISTIINISMVKSDENPFINISSENRNTIQLIHIKKNKYSTYCNVTEGDDETIKIDKVYYNFVKFLDNKNKNIKVDIKFKDNLDNNIYYGIVKLLNINEDYLPRAESFKKAELIENYKSEKVKKKDKSIKIDKIEENENKDIYTAFILSIDSKAEIKHDYSIIINEDIMNTFLLGSIIVALIFAIITFFLIRRKQNMGEKKSGEEFLEEKQDEEKET